MNDASQTGRKLLPVVAAWLLAPLLVLAVAITYVVWSTRDVGAVAQAVMDDWKAGAGDAFFERHAAPAFTNSTNTTDLALLRNLTALEHAEIDWTGRGHDGRFAHASLDLVHGGQRAPVTLSFERIGDDWKLRGIAAAPVAPPLPGDRAALSSLLAASTASLLRTFALGAQQGTLAPLHAKLSRIWQSGTSVAQLETALGGFLTPGADITGVIGRDPVLDEVTLEKDGLIAKARGHYDVGDNRLSFDIGWVREGAVLRPIGMNISVDSKPTP